MVEVVYKEKTFLNTSTTALDNKKHMKVSTCPYCNISTDATRVGIKNNALPINSIFFLLYLSAKIPDGISKITFIKYEIVTKTIYPLEDIPFSR